MTTASQPTTAEVLAVLLETQEATNHDRGCAFVSAFADIKFIRGSRKQDAARREAHRIAPACDCFKARLTGLIARLSAA